MKPNSPIKKIRKGHGFSLVTFMKRYSTSLISKEIPVNTINERNWASYSQNKIEEN